MSKLQPVEFMSSSAASDGPITRSRCGAASRKLEIRIKDGAKMVAVLVGIRRAEAMP